MFDSDYQLIKPICFTISKTVRFIFWGPGGMLKLTKYIYIKKKPKLKAQTRSKRKPNKIKTNPEAESLELSCGFSSLPTEDRRCRCRLPLKIPTPRHSCATLQPLIASRVTTTGTSRRQPLSLSPKQSQFCRRPHHTSASSLLSQISVSPQQPYHSSLNRLQKPTTAAHGSSPRVHDNNLSEPASAKKGKLMEFVAADLFVCD